MTPKSRAMDRSIRERYQDIRAFTASLAEGLEAEDQVIQTSPSASPTKWHLAHTTWFFETFILKEFESDFAPFHPAFEMLFNSYYNGVGDAFPRTQRGLLSRPTVSEVASYRANVDERVDAVLAKRGAESRLLMLVEIGLQHEQQHQELLLTDIKTVFALNPLRPVFREATETASIARETRFVECEGGLTTIGRALLDSGFCYDNETPEHRVFLEPFAMASRPVTAGAYQGFIADGGYQRSDLWLSEGWDLCQSQGWEAPLYWERVGEDWHQMTLHGFVPVDPNEPVVHVSHFEADAFAAWAGARLPTEFEWESFSKGQSMDGNFSDSLRFHPSAGEGTQLFGDVWEWTSSSYAPYPGYRALEGTLGEYNGKFMSNQYVLRGGSCATPAAHIRNTYRNFFQSAARWQFSGIRLAKDIR